MKNKLLLLSSLAAIGLSVNAQELKEGYIKYPESHMLPTYINDWTPGQALFEDENFFISRVKPRNHFRNVATQVNPNLTEETDKKLVFWVPMGSGSVNGIMQNAMPNGDWNTEMFSMWSYVPHFGNFSMQWGWVIGAMADVAHKNGTAVSGVASIPWGSIMASWRESLVNFAKVDKEKAGRFFLYHGVDGLTYNSEFSTEASVVAGVRDMHEALGHYMAEVVNGEPRNPKWENIWYDGTNDNGSITFDRGLGTHNQLNFGDAENPRSSLFFNYNWNNGNLEKSAEYAKQLGRSSMDIYAGVNMQGGEPATNNWEYLQRNPISIGLWGAHDTNMIWAARNGNGADAESAQAYYQTLIEQFFTNGNRNPINTIKVVNSGRISPAADFWGMSSYLSARSALSWDLAKEPFITNFNLGNGKFFNWKGETVGTSAWANLGIQDYMPTWRWWWSKKYLGNEVSDVPANPLTAVFAWDEAFLGGSSLAIKGTADDTQYLHLFKTKFALKNADTFTIRYKLLGGSAKITLVSSVEGSESTPIDLANFVILDSNDQWDQDKWVTKTVKISGALTPRFNNKTLAALALKIEGAKDLDLRLGEISIVRNAATTPAAPEIKLAKVLYNGPTGVDAKVIFNMRNNKAADEPCYNLDVNTSMFKLYAQIEGQEETLISATTSWAGLLYSIPCDPTNIGKKVRVGVSAVALDLNSESAITWSDWMDNAAYEYKDGLELSKTSIKPGESFAVRYTDPNHPTANLKIIANGKTLSGQAGMGREWTVDGIDQVGQYDLVEEVNGTTRTHVCFIPITGVEMGRQPEILSLTANDKDAEATIDAAKGAVKLGYTGREADGAASVAVKSEEKYVGCRLSDLGLDALQSFSITAWVKFDLSSGSGSRFFAIEDRMGSWPQNNWGYFWSGFDAEGNVENYTFRTSNANGSPEIKHTWAEGYGKIVPNSWTHVALVFDYNGQGGFKSDLYINGVKQVTESYARGADTYEGDHDYLSNSYPLGESMWLSIGGGAGSQPIYNNALIDDVAIFRKSLNADEVAKAMKGIEASRDIDNCLAWWTFENTPNEDHSFYPEMGSATTGKCGRFDLLPTGPEGQAQQTYTEPKLDAGSPFITGTGYKVVTAPTWTVKNAVQTNAKGTATEGSVDLAFRAERDYNVTLTLANSLGKDVRTYPVIKASTGAVDTVGADSDIATYTTEDGVIVAIEEAGDYTVSVYNLQGMTVAEKSAKLDAGDHMTIGIANQGVYLVKIVLNGKDVRTVKILKK